MMVHLHHPCFDWDILVTPIGTDEKVLRGQGYISIAEVITLAQQADTLRAELNAALDALRAAPKPPWHFRPTIGWQGVYSDWYEAQVALGKEE